MNDPPLRALPALGRLLEWPALAAARERHSRAAVADAARAVLDAIRSQRPRVPAARDRDDIVARVLLRLEAEAAPRLRPVINATGIVLHTNLGRAPLDERAALAAYEAARNYLDLELDLSTGKRSSRQDSIREGLRRLTGAESATAVNNCAAATVMALRSVASGREVVVSRGQLVEIGGGFRVPDIMAASGAVLREVGTTNVTRIEDYERAIGPNTAALMRVHASNYRVRGYARGVDVSELVALGRRRGVPVIDDAGSGSAIDLAPFGLPGEPLVSAGIAAGAELVLFSGDKLLGGPQAGLIAGRAARIEAIERDPFMRAVRPDKMTLAALEATLRIYRCPERALAEVPTLRMLTTPVEELHARCEALASSLRAAGANADVAVRRDVAYAGGGALPDVALPTAVVTVEPRDDGEAELAARLRKGTPAVLGRVREGAVWLDLRAVFARQEGELSSAVACASNRTVSP